MESSTKNSAKLITFILILFGVAVALFHRPQDSEVGKSENSLEIYYMLNESEPQAKWLEDAAERFEKLHPGLEVEIVYAGREVLGKVRPRFLIGNPPDLVNQGTDILRTLAIAGLLEPLDEALAGPAYDSDIPWKDTFIDGLVDVQRLQGKVYQVPTGLWSSVVFYDKAMFRRFSLEEPATWDEFLDVCRVLQENGIEPIASDGTEPGYNVMWYTAMLMRAADPAHTRRVILGEPGTSWQEEPFVEVARLVRQLRDEGYIMEGYEGSKWPSAQNRWAQGESAMLYCGTWIPKEMAKDLEADFEMGMFRFPILEEFPEGAAMGQEIGGEAWGVPRQSKNKKLAVEFLRYITRLEEARLLVELDVAPATKGAGMPASLESLTEILSPPHVLMTGTGGSGNDIRDEWYRQVAKDLWSDLWLGRVEPEEMCRRMDEAQEQYEAWLERKGEGGLVQIREPEEL